MPACWVLACSLLGACGPSLPRAPERPKHDPEAAADKAHMAGFSRDEPKRFELLPGDIIDVTTVSTETKTHESIRVDAAGFVHLPLVEDVKVGGLGLGPARIRIQQALRRFDRLATVQLAVREALGHRITVLGAVGRPGPVQLVAGMRLADVIALAGGPAVEISQDGTAYPVADLGGAAVYRQGYQLPVDVGKAVLGDLHHNIFVRAGDSVYVPAFVGRGISVLGAVNGGAVLPYQPGLRLTQALAMAGGITIDADAHDVRILRTGGKGTRVYRASFRDIVDGDSNDILVRPGDVLYVADHPMADFGEVLDRVNPILSLGFNVAFIVFAVQRR